MGPNVEQAKLTANFLNALAAGTVLAAIVGPYISWGMGVTSPATDLGNMLGISGLATVVGFVLHLVARRMLGGLQ